MTADWLNYHHLLYFWTVVRQGSITAACSHLHVAQPTISGQLKKLEKQVGGKLYQRSGRELVLTELGRTVFKYADEIFALGQELAEAIDGQLQDRPLQLRVGVPEVLPKLIAFRLLKPAMLLTGGVQLICREGSQKQLLAMLAAHELDVIFSDTPASALVSIRAFNHSLGECGVGLFGSQSLRERHPAAGPKALHHAPFLMPTPGTALRRSVEQWLLETDTPVRVVAELDDTTLMKIFAEANIGFMPAPLAIGPEISQKYGLQCHCVIPKAREQFFAITVERKLRHPAVVAISEFARQELFGSDSSTDR